MLVLMPMLADILGGWEVPLILVVVLILFGAKHLPRIGRALAEGLMQFRKGIDQETHDAGEGLGGIYGKPAAEALTHDNQTAEFYDPAVFDREGRASRATRWMRLRRWQRWWRLVWHSVLKRLKAKI